MKLDDVLKDNQSGSYVITTNSLLVMKNELENGRQEARSAEQILDSLQEISRKLIRNQPNMVLLRRETGSVIQYMKRMLKAGKADAEILEIIYQKLSQQVEDITSMVSRIAGTASRIIANSNNIMTISNSSLVREVFIHTDRQKKRFDTWCMKSHPPDEGIKMAEFLISIGQRSVLIPDAAIGQFLPEMNLVMLGADRLVEDGFINKAGSLPLCLTAQFFKIPVYLVADTMKILPRTERAVKTIERDSAELYDNPDIEFQVSNRYYDFVPFNLVHKIISEKGVFESDEFVRWYMDV